MRWLALLFWLAATPALAQFAPAPSATAGNFVSSVPGLATPKLIQHVASSANPVGLGINGNNFVIPLPNAVQAGDALVVGITYPHGGVITISDTLGLSWPPASEVQDAGSGAYVQAVYVYCGIPAGTETLTIGIGSSTLPFQYTISEFSGIKQQACVDGGQITEGGTVPANGTISTASATITMSVAAPGYVSNGNFVYDETVGAELGIVSTYTSTTLTLNANAAHAGSGSSDVLLFTLNNIANFTPSSNNNASGGHVIWNYVAPSAAVGSDPTLWTPNSGYTALDGDIAWISDTGFPHGSQWELQTTNASTAPFVVPTGDTADLFGGVAVALLAAPGGGSVPASGAYINKVVFFTNQTFTSGQSWTLQSPVVGSVRIVTSATSNASGSFDTTAIAASDGCTWHSATTIAAGTPSVWYATGCSPGNVTMTLTNSGTLSGSSLYFYDISGITTFDVVATAGPTTCSSVTTINDQPTIAPNHSPGLVVAVIGEGQGPTTGFASGSPAGAVFDPVTYTGESDTDLMTNASGPGHLLNSSTATENWNWAITSSAGNSCYSAAATFH